MAAPACSPDRDRESRRTGGSAHPARATKSACLIVGRSATVFAKSLSACAFRDTKQIT